MKEFNMCPLSGTDPKAASTVPPKVQLSDLPYELLIKVVNFVTPQDRVRLSATSRKFYDIIANPSYWPVSKSSGLGCFHPSTSAVTLPQKWGEAASLKLRILEQSPYRSDSEILTLRNFSQRAYLDFDLSLCYIQRMHLTSLLPSTYASLDEQAIVNPLAKIAGKLDFFGAKELGRYSPVESLSLKLLLFEKKIGTLLQTPTDSEEFIVDFVGAFHGNNLFQELHEFSCFRGDKAIALDNRVKRALPLFLNTLLASTEKDIAKHAFKLSEAKLTMSRTFINFLSDKQTQEKYYSTVKHLETKQTLASIRAPIIIFWSTARSRISRVFGQIGI